MTTIFIGLSIGMLLFLLASGLTLIFGMLGVVNFAHGSFYMLGAYVAYQIVAWSDSFWIALIFAPIVLGAVGVLMEMLTLRPLYKRDHLYQLLLTFGAIYVLEELVRLTWGFGYKAYSAPALFQTPIEVFGSTISSYRLLVIIVGTLVSFFLYWMLEKTSVGMVVRAASSNSEMVQTLGIDVSKVRTAVFGIGAALAGVGGVMAGPLLPIQLGMGMNIIIDCFIVVVIGGLGNIRGAILGALLIGITQAVGQRYLPDWVSFLTYVLLLLTLLSRPEGLFSKKGRAV